MFLDLLETKKEKDVFLTLCFAVAIAEPHEMGEKGKKLFTTSDFTYSFCRIFDNSKLMTVCGMKDAEVVLFEKVALSLGLRKTLSPGCYTDFDCKPLETFLEKAEEVFQDYSNTILFDAMHFPPDEHHQIFESAIKYILQGTNFCTKKQKTMLFEMSNMAFSDGDCSVEERDVLQITGEMFGLDSETIKEIIEKSSELNSLYLECFEIIYE